MADIKKQRRIIAKEIFSFDGVEMEGNEPYNIFLQLSNQAMCNIHRAQQENISLKRVANLT